MLTHVGINNKFTNAFERVSFWMKKKRNGVKKKCHPSKRSHLITKQ